MDYKQLKSLLQRYNLKPNFTYGQNFLIDDAVLENIVDAADINQNDMVLEIGAGIGNLTRKLVERAGFVLSIEKDPKFYPVLRAIKKDHKDNFRFEIADVLKFDFQKVLINRSGSADSNPDLRINTDSRYPQSSVYPDIIRKSGSRYKVVANIPYYITGKILQMLMTHLRSTPSAPAGEINRGSSSVALAKEDDGASVGDAAALKLTSITILTQKEVAENVTAKAGDLSLLAISVQLYGEPKIVKNVSKESFYPAPKVDSAILKIDLFKKSRYEITDEKKFFKILRACFAGKRKQIHNTLKNNLKLDKDQVTKILSITKINPAARPQELSIEDWIRLSKLV